MHTICKSFGDIVRIVIFRKTTLQSMVEFTTTDAAVRAKKELQGSDIYSGCCTLKTEFAKVTLTMFHTFKNQLLSGGNFLNFIK